MKEEFLHYLWKYRLYYHDKLIDNEGNKIIVIHPGEYNRDSGPDFFNARLRIDGTEWAGNIEIHLSASHFETHGHHHDPAYDNVILHVVAEKDRITYNSKGSEILTVALQFDTSIYDLYQSLVNNPLVIACQPELPEIDPFIIDNWFNRVVVERLEQKSAMVLKLYSETGHDWEETLYRLLARYFGFRVNTDPFEMLASSLPSRIIRKHADNRFQVEALLYGTAGMLEEALFREAINDEYYVSLVKEFKILATKYSLMPIHGWLWKFSRLRPVNFPTVRISQFAAMLTVSGGLFSRILETYDISGLRQLLEVQASDYWDTHYIFGKVSKKSRKGTGDTAAGILQINVIVPILFTYGKFMDDQDICERAINFLEESKAEDNFITREWKAAGIEARSGCWSQAMVQLRSKYCSTRRCLECMIGNWVISRGRALRKNEELILEP